MLISKRKHYQELEEAVDNLRDYYIVRLRDKDQDIKELQKTINALMTDYENIKGLNRIMEERAKLLEIENAKLRGDNTVWDTM